MFDEARYFAAKNRSGLARSFGGFTFGVTVCEDAWQSAGMTPSSYAQDPIEHIAEWTRQGVDIHATVNLSASPFHTEKFTTRLAVARHAAAVLNHPFLLANQVGGNDDLLFDGRSLVVWPDGRAVVAPSWQEGVLIVDLNDASACTWVGSHADDALSIGSATLMVLEPGDDGSSFVDTVEELTNAVVAGLADYCEIQVSYAIGVAKPTSINVNTFNSEKISKQAIEKIVEEKFDLRPKSLINMLDLKRPIYLPTAAYGHFGRTDTVSYTHLTLPTKA